MASHTQLVYGVQEENESEIHTDTSTDIIVNHLVNDVHSIHDLFLEEENTIHILRYMSSILEEDTNSSRIISPDPRRMNLLAKNLNSLPQKEAWHLFLKLIQMTNGCLENLTRNYIENNQIDPALLEKYSAIRNLLWSFVIGTGCQFSQTKGPTSKKRFHKLRPILSPTEGTSHFFCLPMAQRCRLLHLNFVGGSRRVNIDDVIDYGNFVKDIDVLPDNLQDAYQTFHLDLGETLTISWIEWLTNMGLLKKNSRFIHTLCMVTFQHLVSYFIEIGFDKGNELHKLLELPFHLSVEDWLKIFSPFVLGNEEDSCPAKFSYFTECFGKWQKNHQAKKNASKISTDWHELVRSCLAFVQHSNEMKKKKNHSIWTDARDLFGQTEIDNWKLKRGFPLPIDCCYIKFSDVISEIYCWSSLESHFVAIVFMALGSLEGEAKVNIENVFQKEIDRMKEMYNSTKKKKVPTATLR